MPVSRAYVLTVCLDLKKKKKYEKKYWVEEVFFPLVTDDINRQKFSRQGDRFSRVVQSLQCGRNSILFHSVPNSDAMRKGLKSSSNIWEPAVCANGSDRPPVGIAMS